MLCICWGCRWEASCLHTRPSFTVALSASAGLLFLSRMSTLKWALPKITPSSNKISCGDFPFLSREAFSILWVKSQTFTLKMTRGEQETRRDTRQPMVASLLLLLTFIPHYLIFSHYISQMCEMNLYLLRSCLAMRWLASWWLTRLLPPGCSSPWLVAPISCRAWDVRWFIYIFSFFCMILLKVCIF